MRFAKAKLFAPSALALGLMLGTLGAAHAQLTPEPAWDMPDEVREYLPLWQEGTWGFQGTQGCEYTFCWENGQRGYNEGDEPRYEIPLIPGGEMEARWAEIREGLQQGHMLWDPDARCIPSGMPQLTRTGGFRMIATEEAIFMIWGGEQKYRIIWMDGRDFPERPERDYTFNGDSIGHWDEDGNLVIETRNITGEYKAVGPHLPMSNNFWVQEVWRIVEPGRIETTVTMMDEDNWTRPHTETWHYNHNPEGELGRQTVCVNGGNQLYLDDGTGDFTLHLPGGIPLEPANL